MKLSTSIAALVLSYGAVLSADAWTITPSDVQSRPNATSNHQDFIKYWTVEGKSTLTSVTVDIVGRVFVDYDASLATVETQDVSYASSGSGASEEDVAVPPGAIVARVAVSGDSQELLNAIEVVAVSPENDADGIKLRFKNEDFDGAGYLLTEIAVGTRQALASIATVGAGDLIIAPDALAHHDSNGTIELTAAGSGDVFVNAPNETLDIGALEIATAGSGDVQVDVGRVQVQTDVEINIAGSGSIAIVAADAVVVGETLSSSIGGSGDVFVQSAWLETSQLETSIAGSGGVTYSRNGSCATQHVEVAGSGDVAAGSIVCVNTSVEIVGSGDVLVQTTEELDVSTVFSGTVKYVSGTPKTIVSSGVLHFRRHHDTVSQAKKNKFDEYELKTVPPREAMHVKLRLRESLFSDEPRQGGFWSWLMGSDDDSEGEDTTLSLSRHMPTASSPAMGAVLLMAVGGVGMMVALRRIQQQRERRQYQPLLH